jgi:hypothetical protein
MSLRAGRQILPEEADLVSDELRGRWVMRGVTNLLGMSAIAALLPPGEGKRETRHALAG